MTAHNVNRHPRSRAVLVLVASGVVLGLLWQFLAPLGALTARPSAALPGDVPSVASDGWFTGLAGAAGLVAAMVFVVTKVARRPPRSLAPEWVQWVSAGVISCVVMLLTGVVAEFLTRLVAGPPAGPEAPGSGPLHQLSLSWEISSFVTLLVWPALFSLTTAIGATLASMFGEDLNGQPEPDRRGEQDEAVEASPSDRDRPPPDFFQMSSPRT